MIYKLTKDASISELEAAGLGLNYAQRDHCCISYRNPREQPVILDLKLQNVQHC